MGLNLGITRLGLEDSLLRQHSPAEERKKRHFKQVQVGRSYTGMCYHVIGGGERGGGRDRVTNMMRPLCCG